MPRSLSPTPRCPRWAMLVAVVAAVNLLTLVATAKLPEVTLTSPGGGPTGANGLTATLSYEPLLQFGYQRVNLLIRAPQPVNADRQITVRVYADRAMLGMDTERYDIAVEQDGELPAGTKEVSLALDVPKLHDWAIVRYEVWVDGVHDTTLSGLMMQNNQGAGPRVELFTPTGLRDRTSIRFERRPGWGPGGPEMTVGVDTEPLSSDWRAYESYHAVIVSAEKLANAARTDPAGVAALMRWLSLGGRLLIEDAGEDFERLASIDKLLGQTRQPFDKELAREQQEETRDASDDDQDLAVEEDANPLEPSDGDADASSDAAEDEEEVIDKPPPFDDHPDWRWARVMLPMLTPAAPQGPSQGPSPAPQPGPPTGMAARLAGGPPTGPGPPNEPRGRRRRVGVDAWFLECPIGFGAATAFPGRVDELPPTPPSVSDDGDPVDAGSRWQLRSVARYIAGMDWRERHGMTPDRGSSEFANWLVPGVGAAPVDAFRWMITLFVLLVGPASFFFFRIYHRTQLMALTAPLAAAAFTLGLFAYATFSDGIGLRVRSRSLTFLDQQAGQASSWSRQSYYAGLAPAEGLTFSHASAVYPILPPWDIATRDASKSHQRELLVSPDAQQLSRGWLSSRDTSQLLVLNSEPTSATLQVDADESAVRVVNRLGAELNLLFVLDRDARWWTAADVAHEQAADLATTTRPEVVEAVRKAFLAAAPLFPVGIGGDDSGRESSLLGRTRPRGRVSNDANLDGRLAYLLSDIEGRNDGLTAALKPGSFLAISSQRAAAPIGHPDARELGSFHVTVGVWEGPQP